MKQFIATIAGLSLLSGCATIKPSATWMYRNQPATAEQIAQSKQDCGWKSDLSKLYDTYQKESLSEAEQINRTDQMFKQKMTCMATKGYSVKTISGTDHSINARLSMTAQKMNLLLPIFINNAIILDKLETGDKELRFKYTILNRKLSALAPHALTKTMRAMITRDNCHNLYSEQFITHHIPTVHIFRDKQGKEISSIKLFWEDCQPPLAHKVR